MEFLCGWIRREAAHDIVNLKEKKTYDFQL